MEMGILIKSVMEKRKSDLNKKLVANKKEVVNNFLRDVIGNSYESDSFTQEVKEFPEDEFLKLLNNTKAGEMHQGGIAFIQITEKGEASLNKEDTAEIIMINVGALKATFICREIVPVQDDGYEIEENENNYDHLIELEEDCQLSR